MLRDFDSVECIFSFFSIILYGVIWKEASVHDHSRKNIPVLVRDGEKLNDCEIKFMDKKVACQYPLMSKRLSVKLIFGNSCQLNLAFGPIVLS